MLYAICDDQYIEVKTIEEHLKDKGIEVDIYDNGEALVAAYRDQNQRYDALFIDMEMVGMNGFETANAVSDIDDTVLIVFVTSHEEYVYECFKCSPVWFLRKPVDPSELNQAINMIEHRIKKRRRTYTFIDSRQSVRLRCDEILYFESQRHYINIHTKNGKIYTFRKTMKELEHEMDGAFCRVHDSYMVNLQYLINMVRDKDTKTEYVILEYCTEKIPIGRTYKKNVSSAFLKFKGEEYMV